MIRIFNLDKARVLKALYDHSSVNGMGVFAAASAPKVTVEHCQELLKKQDYFDYLYGRVLKVSLSESTIDLDERLYDRDNGPGAAENAILEEFTTPEK